MDGYGAGYGAAPPPSQDYQGMLNTFLSNPQNAQAAQSQDNTANPLYQAVQSSVNAPMPSPSPMFQSSQGNTNFGGVPGMNDEMYRPQLDQNSLSMIQSLQNAPQQQAPSWNPNTNFGGVQGMDDMMYRPSLQKGYLAQLLGGMK